MIAVVIILLAFPLGYLCKTRLTANTAYSIAYLWAFTYQTLYLTRFWVGGDHSAFPQNPKAFPISYGVFAALFMGVGFGLVTLGHRLRDRRLAKAASEDPAAVTTAA